MEKIISIIISYIVLQESAAECPQNSDVLIPPKVDEY